MLEMEHCLTETFDMIEYFDSMEICIQSALIQRLRPDLFTQAKLLQW